MTLTDREKRVLEMMSSGDSNRKIADEFGISQRRVQQIEQDIERKLAFARKREEVEHRLREVVLEPDEEAVIRFYWDLDPPEGTRDNFDLRQCAMKKLSVSYD